MNGWRKTRLDACTRIVSGATPSTSVAAYWDGPVHWATPKDLSDLEGAYLASTPRTISDKGLAACSAEVLPPNSVLFSSRAPIGHVAINLQPTATNQGFKSFIPDAEQLDSKFLYYWLKMNRPYLEGLGNGATFKEVSKYIVARIEICLPPVEEQRRIAAILDQAEALRSKRRQALAKLDTLTQSLFLEMFGDPLTNPKQWRTAKIGEMADVQGGLQVTPIRAAYELQVPYLRVANVYRDRLDLAVIKTIGATQNEFVRTQLELGDVLIVEGHGNPSEIGRCSLWDGSITGCVHQNHLIRVRFDQSTLLPSYASNFLNSPVGRRQLLGAARTTSGLNTINVSNVKGVKMLVPSMSLQSKYCERSLEIQRAKGAAIRQQERLDTLFASLQNRAFHGEL